MGDAADVADLRVQLHEAHNPHHDTAVLEGRVLDLEAQLASARDELAAHLATYHAPEPEPEPEREEEEEEEEEEEPEPPAEEKAPEPEPPEPERAPEPSHFILRGVLNRE